MSLGEMGVVIHQLVYVMNTEMWISRCMQSRLTQTQTFNVQILHLLVALSFSFCNHMYGSVRFKYIMHIKAILISSNFVNYSFLFEYILKYNLLM